LQDKKKMARSIDPRRKTSREVQRQNETVPTGWSLRRGTHLGQPPWSGNHQAGHMEANDPMHQNSNFLAKRGRPHMDFCRIVRIAMGVRRWTWSPSVQLGLAPRFAGLGVVRASILALRTKGAQIMPAISVEKTPNLESAAPKKGKSKPSAPSRRKPPSGAANLKKAPSQPVVSKATQIGPAKTPAKAQEPGGERITKRERMLTLLSQPSGASIAEMMQATGWQQHSVRGFLAGTVKRKLGFSLTSFKPGDGLRRYRIEKRRGR
jgi:hypothetical protein